MAKARKKAPPTSSHIEAWHGCLVDACTGKVWRAATRREASALRRRKTVLVIDGRPCVLHGAVVSPGTAVKVPGCKKPAKKKAGKKKAGRKKKSSKKKG